jgi:hypothetical protein
MREPAKGGWEKAAVGAGVTAMFTAITVRFIVLLFAALATGALVANWIGLARAMGRLSSPSAYAEFHQASTETFDPYIPIVVWGALLGGVALTALSPGLSSTPGQLAVAGFFCYAAVIAISLPTGVRMNQRIARWSIESPPDDWAHIRARWIRFHILRTLISVPGLACYLLSGLLQASLTSPM